MAALPFDPSTLGAGDRIAYDAMVARRAAHGAPFDGPYLALMNHPQLCARIEELGYYLKFQGHLARDVYQFVVLSVARATDAPFEWDDHVANARAAGVPDAGIASLQAAGPGGAAYPAPYAVAAQVLDATLRWQDIPQPVQDAAIADYTMQGFVEVVVLSGFYQLFSTVNKGFAIRKGVSP